MANPTAKSLGGFKEKDQDDWEKEGMRSESKHFSKLQEQRERDNEWKIKNRPIVGWTLLGLFLGQNFLVFLLIFIAYFQSKLGGLEVILGVIMTGTLAETAFGVKTIIKWMFSDIDYKRKK